MNENLKSRSQIQRVLTQSPGDVIKEIETLRARVKELEGALKEIMERNKPGTFDNDPLGMGIIDPDYRIARKALANKVAEGKEVKG